MPQDDSSPSTSTSSSSGGASTSGSIGAKEVLLTAGAGLIAGMVYFYKRKQTLPFKVRALHAVLSMLERSGRTCQHACSLAACSSQVCYGLSWPVLGGGIMLAVTPSPEQMEQVRAGACCGDNSSSC